MEITCTALVSSDPWTFIVALNGATREVHIFYHPDQLQELIDKRPDLAPAAAERLKRAVHAQATAAPREPVAFAGGEGEILERALDHWSSNQGNTTSLLQVARGVRVLNGSMMPHGFIYGFITTADEAVVYACSTKEHAMRLLTYESDVHGEDKPLLRSLAQRLSASESGLKRITGPEATFLIVVLYTWTQSRKARGHRPIN